MASAKGLLSYFVFVVATGTVAAALPESPESGAQREKTWQLEAGVLAAQAAAEAANARAEDAELGYARIRALGLRKAIEEDAVKRAEHDAIVSRIAADHAKEEVDVAKARRQIGMLPANPTAVADAYDTLFHARRREAALDVSREQAEVALAEFRYEVIRQLVEQKVLDPQVETETLKKLEAHRAELRGGEALLELAKRS